MIYEELNNIGIIKGYKEFLAIQEINQSREIQLRSREDFSIIKIFDLGVKKFAYHHFEGVVVLSNLKDYHIEIRIDDKLIKERTSEHYLISESTDYSLFYYPKTKEYVSVSLDLELKRFAKNSDKEFKFYASSIIEIKMNDKKDSSVLSVNTKNGSENWKKEYPWQIVRCEQYNNLLILDYHAYDNKRTDEGFEGEIHWANPNVFTIVLDIETGEEVWSKTMAYSKIDKRNGVVLAGGKKITEVDINSGKFLTDIEILPKSDQNCYASFVDADFVYYTNDKGSFGKIKKDTGIIEWEFDLIDEQGAKRMLSEWLVLDNGNLVLQTLPNHSNGDLTCIFNPTENLKYSNVKEGKRVNPPPLPQVCDLWLCERSVAPLARAQCHLVKV